MTQTPTRKHTDRELRIMILEPLPRHEAAGRPIAFTPSEVETIYKKRREGVTWGQINDVLDRPYKRPSALAAGVHRAALAHGIDKFVEPRTPKKAAAE